MDIKNLYSWIKEINLYSCLGVETEATEEEIRRAYRKSALKVHPDKNPSQEAVEVFHKLQDALKILTDYSARKAYDRMRIALKSQEIKNRELDAKQLCFKRRLEEREREAANNKRSKSPEEMFDIELKRVRQENDKVIKEENERILKEMQKSRECRSSATGEFKLKIKWEVAKNDSTNGGYDYDSLHRFLHKYGDIDALITSQKKKGRAIVVFKDQSAAEMAVQYEKGIISNPIKIKWIGEAPKSNKPGFTIKITDYESLVMREVRLAEERKRVMEQMQKEDELET